MVGNVQKSAAFYAIIALEDEHFAFVRGATLVPDVRPTRQPAGIVWTFAINKMCLQRFHFYC